ncbi:hypothetical protein L3Q67_45390 (plasmid) [Saccharothrix sp. AJ9571]|nr:hypothetical protein L3Q67_45390 [Saccharothrix sp. AJ9571]
MASYGRTVEFDDVDQKQPAGEPDEGLTTAEPASSMRSRLTRGAQFAHRLTQYLLLLPFLLFPPYSTLMLVYNPLNRQERRALEGIGLSRAVARRAHVATICGGVGVTFSWFAIGLVPVHVMNLLSMKPPPSLISHLVVGLILSNAVVGLPLLAITAASPRIRLLISATRCIRLLLLFRDNPVDPDLRWYRFKMRNHLYRQRRMAGLAWALTRDQARLAGRSTAEPGLGEVLLWYAESPHEARRRAIFSGYMVEMITAISTGETVPDVQFPPAKRFATRSPRSRFARLLRTIVTAALTSSIIAALLTALLKLVVK